MTQPRFNLKSGNSSQRLSFPRFLLAQASLVWTEEWQPETSFCALPRSRDAEKIPLHFAPPLLEDRETGAEVSQLPAIVLYLLDALDLRCDRVDAMRIMGDALDLFAELDRAKVETQSTNDRAWWRFKHYELQDWMRMHDAWADAKVQLQAEAVLLAAIWIPICDFFPSLWPILEREAPGLHTRVSEVGKPLQQYRELGDLNDRAYIDPFRDGSLRKMDDEAGPPPHPIHDFTLLDRDA